MSYPYNRRLQKKKDPQMYRSYIEYRSMENEINRKRTQLENSISWMVTSEIGLGPTSDKFGFDEKDREKRLLEIEKSEKELPKYTAFLGLLIAGVIALVIITNGISLWFLGAVLVGLLVYLVISSSIVEKFVEQQQEKIKNEFPRFEEYKKAKEEYNKIYSHHYCEMMEKYKNNFINLDKERCEKYWSNLSGQGFEIELAKLFQKLGYKAELTSASGDQGIDIKLNKNGEFVVVQCKAHKARVGPHIVRDLYGAMKASGADKAVLASISGFSEGVVTFVKEDNKPIVLISLPEIVYMSIMEKTIEGL